MKKLRFLPLVALATSSLLVLKLAGLVLDGRFMLTGTQAIKAQNAPDTGKAQPAANQAGAPATPGSAEKAAPATAQLTDGAKPASAPAEGKPGDKRADGQKADKNSEQPPKDMAGLLENEYRSRGEIALLTSLSERREALDKREKQIELRMNLLKAAEKKIEERIAVLKDLESKIQRFAKEKENEKADQYGRLVKMYSSMKPKDAARIFDELNSKVLLGLIKEMKPASMSAIMAQMNPAKARELTVAMAGVAKQPVTERVLEELPKIEGQ